MHILTNKKRILSEVIQVFIKREKRVNYEKPLKKKDLYLV